MPSANWRRVRLTPGHRRTTSLSTGSTEDKSSAASRTNTRSPPDSPTRYKKRAGHRHDRVFEPNGVEDDVVTIELRAIAGAVYPLIDPSYVVDAVVPAVTDGLTGTSVTNQPLTIFPYPGVPFDGYDNPS